MKTKIFFIVAVIIVITASTGWPQNKPTNQQIVEAAQRYPDGAYIGACRHFITHVMQDVGVTLEGGYKDCYKKVGYEVPINEALPGDVMQTYNNADPETFVDGYHSAFVLENKGNGVFNAIHCNWCNNNCGIISRNEVDFVKWVASKSTSSCIITVHIYRLGTIGSLPTDIIGLFPGDSVDPILTPLFKSAQQIHLPGGVPIDNGGGPYVHNWNGRWIQDFRMPDGKIKHLVYNNEQGAVWPIQGANASYWFNHYGELGSVAPTGPEIPSIYGGQSTSFINHSEICVVLKLGTGQEGDDRRKTIVWTERNGATHYPVGMFSIDEPVGAGAVVYEWISGQEYRWPSGHDVVPTGDVVFAPAGGYYFILHDPAGNVYPPVLATITEGNKQIVRFGDPTPPDDPPAPPSPDDGNPILWASDNNRDFDVSANNLPLEVKNNGTGTLNWSFSCSQSWLTFSETSGSLSAGQGIIVTIYLNRNQLAVGENLGTLNISSNGGSLAITIRAFSPAPPDQPVDFPLIIKCVDMDGRGIKKDGVMLLTGEDNWDIHKRIWIQGGLSWLKAELKAKRASEKIPVYVLNLSNMSSGTEVISKEWQIYTTYHQIASTYRDYSVEINLTKETRQDDYKLLVESLTLTVVSDPPPPPTQKSLRVVSPNGAENWLIGSARIINYESVGDIANVDVFYSINNGQDWIVLGDNISNTGSFNWNITGSASNNCLVKVADASGNIFDVSDACFTLSTSPPPPPNQELRLRSPNGGEQWEKDSQQIIRWTSKNVKDVKLLYSIDNGKRWQTITEAIENHGEYLWTVPGPASDQCLVKVMDLDGSPHNTSDNVFSIIEKVPLPPDTSLVHNGDFSQGLKFWELEVHGNHGCQANCKIEDGAVKISIQAIGNFLPDAENNPYRVQLKQLIPLSNFSAKKYQLTFKYKGSINWFVAELAKNGGDYLPVGFNQRIEAVKNTWQQSSSIFELQKPTDVAELKLNFQVGTKIGEIYFDDIVLEEYTEPVIVPPDTTKDFPLGISLAEITLTKDSPRATLKLSNSTAKALDFTASSGQGYLFIRPNSGTIDPQKKKTVVIEADFSQLRKDEIGKIIFESAGATREIPVIIIFEDDSGIISAVENKKPAAFVLEQNYPNPFNPKTIISFTLPEPGEVSLKIYNQLGEVIATLVSGYCPAGEHQVIFDAAALPNGTYFYYLKAAKFTEIKKMVLLK
jgi:hypothetical protein